MELGLEGVIKKAEEYLGKGPTKFVFWCGLIGVVLFIVRQLLELLFWLLENTVFLEHPVYTNRLAALEPLWAIINTTVFVGLIVWGIYTHWRGKKLLGKLQEAERSYDKARENDLAHLEEMEKRVKSAQNAVDKMKKDERKSM